MIYLCIAPRDMLSNQMEYPAETFPHWAHPLLQFWSLLVQQWFHHVGIDLTSQAQVQLPPLQFLQKIFTSTPTCPNQAEDLYCLDYELNPFKTVSNNYLQTNLSVNSKLQLRGASAPIPKPGRMAAEIPDALWIMKPHSTSSIIYPVLFSQS